MSTNLATIVGGPCKITRDGSTFRSKAEVRLEAIIDTFAVENDLYGEVDQRRGNQPVRVTFTPEGRFADLAVLFPYLAVNLGSLVTPLHTCGAVDTVANTIAVADTSLAAGTPVSFGTTDTMPTGLTAATLYYLSANAAGLRTVHLSAAAAIAGTGAIDITGAGAGTLRFVIQKELVIVGADGTRITVHNAAITKMPTFNGRSTETMWGEVEFEGFVKNGVPRTTANSVLTEDTTVFSDAGFDPADIITQPYSATWGDTAPWVGFYTKNGWVIEPSLELAAVEDDASGIISRRIVKIGFTAKAQPMGVDFAALRAAMKVDGAGAARGASLTGDDLNIEGTDVYVRLYAAALVGGPAQWKTDLERTGELTWRATRTFSGGAANPLFYIGDAAPA
jgi:hypothetical protein